MKEMKRMKRKETVGNHWRKIKRREYIWWLNYLQFRPPLSYM